MNWAEEIAIKEHKSHKIAVISGVGTRRYYKKLGYTLEGPYMVKSLKPDEYKSTFECVDGELLKFDENQNLIKYAVYNGEDEEEWLANYDKEHGIGQR